MIGGHPETPDAAPAVAHCRQALTLAEELGMRPLTAHCNLNLGKLPWRTGKCVEAHEHLNTATIMYQQMKMRLLRKRSQRPSVPVGLDLANPLRTLHLHDVTY